MSFRDPVEFSMVAGRERHFRERLPKLGSRLRVLPISLMYGANASGKSNFVKAFLFARQLVIGYLDKAAPIPVKPFMSPETNMSPTKISFEFYSNGKIYRYYFSLNARRVFEEKLSRIFLDGSEQLLFQIDRGAKKIGRKHTTNFAIAGKNQKENERLNYLLNGTWENQLFLNNSYYQRVDYFNDIVDWFSNLEVVLPNSKYGYLMDGIYQETNFEYLSECLRKLDTGVDLFEMNQKPIGRDEVIKIAKSAGIEDLWGRLEALREGDTFPIDFESLVFLKHKDGIYLLRTNTVRKDKTSGENIEGWSLSMESDGTRRIIDLLPILPASQNAKNSKVYIIDELERSLHPNMTGWLIDRFLSSCGEETRTQMIFTTHDVSLMDNARLRRDELWLAERDTHNNVSNIFSISDYKGVRDDTDLRKNYLRGVFGGVPKIMISNRCQVGAKENSDEE